MDDTDTDEVSRDLEFIGTGRANLSGGSATITTPKEVAEILELDEEGEDLVYFRDGDSQRILMVRRQEVTVRD